MAKGQALTTVRPRPSFDLIALAASAGGLAALSEVLSALPADFPAAIVLVQHMAPSRRSMLAEILGRRTPLTVREARAGELLSPANVFVAPPDQHLLVNPDGTLSLTHTELVHFCRPSADLLFESAAASWKDRAIAVVLTGTGSDGSLGVMIDATHFLRIVRNVMLSSELSAPSPIDRPASIETRRQPNRAL